MSLAVRSRRALADLERKFTVLRTRYLFIYRPRRDGIFVLRLFHSSQNWRR